MNVEQKLQELGLQLPEMAKPIAAYVPAIRVADTVYTSGQIPLVKGEVKFKGKLGREFAIQDGYEAAKICALNCLAATKSVINDLDRIEKVIKVVGFVNSDVGFTDQPKVINGASDLLGKVFGPNGAHARSAVGVAELPLGVAVEIEMIFQIKPE